MASKVSRSRVFVYAVAPILAVLATWLSGFIETSFLAYGFPFAWKTLSVGGTCPPSPVEIACFFRPVLLPVYNWGSFVLDAAFYTALSYASIFAGLMALRKPISWKKPYFSDGSGLKMCETIERKVSGLYKRIVAMSTLGTSLLALGYPLTKGLSTCGLAALASFLVPYTP